MKKCILLVRVSTQVQSLEAQEKELYDLARKDGYSQESITPISYKESGIKLKEEERYGLQEMYKLLDTGEYDCVYAWEVSRIARTKKVLFSVADNLINRKTQLIVKNPWLKLLNEDGSVNEGYEMIFTLYAQMAESEMRNKKVRFSRGKREKASQGKYTGANIPFGYRVNYENNKIIEIDDNQAEIVRTIYNLYESGVSQSKMTDELQKRGYPFLQISLINNILQNESYTGKMSEEKKMKGAGGRGDWIKYPRRYPPIISREQFESCRQIAIENRTKPDLKGKNIYYASNLIVCPVCGGKWVGREHNASYYCYRSHIPASVYVAGGYDKSSKQCDNKTNISINALDSILWEVALRVEESIRTDKLFEEGSRFDDEIINQQNKKKNIQDFLERHIITKKRIGQTFADGYIDEDEYNKRKKLWEDKKNELEQEIVSVDNYIRQLELQRDSLTANVIRHDFSLSPNMDNQDMLDYYDAFLSSADISSKSMEVLRKNANDLTRNDIIHKNIEKVIIYPIEFEYQHRTKRLGLKKVQGKLIQIYTYYEKMGMDIFGEGEYPKQFIYVSNDGFGGKTVFEYKCGTENDDYEWEILDPKSIDLYGGRKYYEFKYEKLERFKQERKIAKRAIEKEERRRFRESSEYQLQQEKKRSLQEQKRKEMRKEYSKKKYYEEKDLLERFRLHPEKLSVEETKLVPILLERKERRKAYMKEYANKRKLAK